VQLELCLFTLPTGTKIAINPLLVRLLRDTGNGNVTIVFSDSHEIIVKGDMTAVIGHLKT
jgi:hypothetical protein